MYLKARDGIYIVEYSELITYDKMSGCSFGLPFFTSRAAGGGHLTTRHCALGERTNIINTYLSSMWGNRWNLGFFQVPSLTYTDRLDYVRT